MSSSIGGSWHCVAVSRLCSWTSESTDSSCTDTNVRSFRDLALWVHTEMRS